MMFRKFTAAIAVAMLIALPAHATREEESVKVTSAKNLAGTQRVVIGQFTIGFVIERKDSTKAGGGLMGSGFGGRSTVRSTLAGYTQAELQQVVDAGYTDFVAQLGTAGFEVADRAAFATYPQLAREQGEPGPKELTTVTGRDDKAKVLFLGASQIHPLRLLPGDALVGGFGGMGLMMAASRTMVAQAAFAKESGTRVINVIYYVDFAKSNEYGGWFRSSSAVKVEGSLAMMPDQSKLAVVGANMKNGTLALAQPVAIGGDFFEKEDTMGGTEKASNAIGNAIGLLGGVGTNSSKKFTFTARPGVYAAGAQQLATEANTVLVQKLATLR